MDRTGKINQFRKTKTCSLNLFFSLNLAILILAIPVFANCYDFDNIPIESGALPTRFHGDLFIVKTAKIGIPILLEARLEEDNSASYDAIQGETVHFDIYVNGSWQEIPDDDISSTSYTTDADGIASVFYTPPKGFTPAAYSIRARYDGSETYTSTSLITTLEIKRPQWLFMVYMAADNNLESAGVDDFYNEMWQARTNDDLSICVLFDRTPSSYNYYEDSEQSDDWSDTRFFRIARIHSFGITWENPSGIWAIHKHSWILLRRAVITSMPTMRR